MVSPLIRTPTAIMASKAPEEVVEREVRSDVEPPRRSPADGPPVEVDWICDAEKRLLEEFR
jgi:hypothetical protein